MDRMSIKDNKCKIVCENPDERFKAEWRERLLAGIQKEIVEFLTEVHVAMRKIQPGQTITMEHVPMIVTIESPAEPKSLILSDVSGQR